MLMLFKMRGGCFLWKYCIGGYGRFAEGIADVYVDCTLKVTLLGIWIIFYKFAAKFCIV